MEIQILGTGCPKCEKLADNARQAVERLGLDAEIVKISDLNEIMSFGVMMTPALALDGEVKAKGKLLGVDQIEALLREESP